MTSRPPHIAALDAALLDAVERFEEADGTRKETMKRNVAEYERIKREIEAPAKARSAAQVDVEATVEALTKLGFSMPADLKDRIHATGKAFYEDHEWRAARVAAKVPVPVTFETEDNR